MDMSKNLHPKPCSSSKHRFLSSGMLGKALALTLLASTSAFTLAGCAGEQLTQGYLLDEAQLRGVLDRRAALLSRVGALIAVHGEDAVLAFP